MSKNNENKLVPELRFPEFKNKEDWELMQIGSILNAESSSLALNKLDLKQSGYAVYGADSIIGYIDTFQHKHQYISIVKDGSGVGRLNFCEGETSTLGTLSALKSKDEKKYHIEWAYYLLNTIDFSSYVKGSGIPHIYYSDYKSQNVGVPKPNEQQKIAACLSSLDEVITAESQKLEMLKDHKKGLLQNLLPQAGETVPQKRFKEFENSGEWSVEKLKNVFSIFQGFAFSSKDSVQNGVRWLKIADVGIQQMNHLSPSYLPNDFIDKYANFLVKKGDYVIALTRPILNNKLKIAKVDETLHNSLLNQRVGKLVSNKCVDFVYYLLQTTKLISSISQNIAGSEPPNLSAQQIENIEVYIPSTIEEQQKIADTLSSVDDLIFAQNQKLEALQLHKKGLLQGLFPSINNEE